MADGRPGARVTPRTVIGPHDVMVSARFAERATPGHPERASLVRTEVAAGALVVPRAMVIGPSAATATVRSVVTVTPVPRVTGIGPSVGTGTDPSVAMAIARTVVTMTPVPRATVIDPSAGTATVRSVVTMTPVPRATVIDPFVGTGTDPSVATATVRSVGTTTPVPRARVIDPSVATATVHSVGMAMGPADLAVSVTRAGSVAVIGGRRATVGPVPELPADSAERTLARLVPHRIGGSEGPKFPRRSPPGICRAPLGTS
ncbi:hypothetical protein [Microbacterium sp. VKM Ac-2923]|uniref:hypothetical protein n=1 Tax=Microbacterium sp. VKM Ac-2923 TaxID=2929476 RepID=UPI001FB421C7|nr:hypothetical protein [Microbacterium sp. VKM Ac-2923]MCJ1707894.1 hypothetical protein [Microbacterium sp. VKM Ac-2923]